MSVRVVDRGANAVLRLYQSGAKDTIDVGVLGSKGEREKGDGVTVADVAEWAEYGIGQPQRSWLRGWIDQNEELIQARIDREMREVIKAKRTKAQALKRIGVWLQGELQMNIANFPDNGLKPNAESTIAAKGSSTPLIDTGQLRSSISHRVNGDEQ